jgi:bifunctional ADP-heptose synthase (sugar kinase/adenylyltransferase)
MVYIIGGDKKQASPTKEQLLHDDKIQPYAVVGESAHFMKRGKPLAKVGVYCGRFDKLTAKDVAFLGLCRSNCDLLIVLVDSDYAIRLKKEKEDVAAKERAFLVASLPFVDWVCLYDDESPDVALNLISPDVIFRGLYTCDNAGVNIKHDKFKQIEHPFGVSIRTNSSGKFFSV